MLGRKKSQKEEKLTGKVKKNPPPAPPPPHTLPNCSNTRSGSTTGVGSWLEHLGRVYARHGPPMALPCWGSQRSLKMGFVVF